MISPHGAGKPRSEESFRGNFLRWKMGNEETLADVIKRSRDELHDAKKLAENTPRANNVCASHDPLFGLVRALCTAVDTMLLVQAQMVRDGTGKMVWVRILRWPATILLSVALFTPEAPRIMDVILKHLSR